MNAPTISPEMFIGLLLLLVLVDCMTTYYLLKRGGRELNPFVDFFIDRLGLHGGLAMTKLLTVAAAVYEAETIAQDRSLSGGVLLVYAGVAVWNFYQIHIYRKRRGR